MSFSVPQAYCPLDPNPFILAFLRVNLRLLQGEGRGSFVWGCAHPWSSRPHGSWGPAAGKNPRCSGDSGCAVLYHPFVSHPTLLGWMLSSTLLLFVYLLPSPLRVKMILEDLRRTQGWLLKSHLSDLTKGSWILSSGSNQFSHLAGESCRVLRSHRFVRSVVLGDGGAPFPSNCKGAEGSGFPSDVTRNTIGGERSPGWPLSGEASYY